MLNSSLSSCVGNYSVPYKMGFYNADSSFGALAVTSPSLSDRMYVSQMNPFEFNY